MFAFAQPYWLLIGAVSSILLWLFWSRQDAMRLRQLGTFAAPALVEGLTSNVSIRRRTVKKLLVLASVFLCFCALARPQYGHKWIDVKRKGIDILFAIDTSRSMLAQDLRPNRLERSKLAIMDFVSRLDGDRVGLLPFAGTSYLMCPLTSDYQAFEQSLMAIDTTLIPAGGTDIEQALYAAEKVIRNEANHKILILITDGENLEGNAVEAARKIHEKGVTIYTVGVGTEEGELIPDRENGGFIKDQNGNFVKSRLDRQTLTKIAEEGSGLYVPLGIRGEGLDTIYRERLALVPKTELAENRRKVPIDRFAWPLALATVLLSIEYLLSGRKSDHSFPRTFARLAKLKKPLFSLFAAVLLAYGYPSSVLFASEGEAAYQAGDYLKAAQTYKDMLEKDPRNPELLYNKGTTAYKNNLFKEAAEAFTGALATSDVNLQEKSFYNKGNALYRQGEAARQANDNQQTVDSWQQALTSYDSALALNPENQKARFNYDFVKKKLEQLQKDQQKDKQQNDSKSESEKNKNDQNTKKKDNQDKQQGQQADKSDKDKGAQPNQAKSSPEKQGHEKNGQETASPSAGQNGEQKDAVKREQQKSEDNNQKSASSMPVQGEKANPEGMTREEAEQLLQAIQGEEKRLDLIVPQGSGNEQTNRKNW